MRFLLSAFLYLLFISVSFAQQPTQLKGRVVSPQGTSLPGVKVALSRTAYTTQTDVNGDFVLVNVPQGRYQLILSQDSLTRSFEVNLTQPLFLRLTFGAHEVSLKEVVVAAVRTPEGVCRMASPDGPIITAGLKTERIVMASLDANTAQNNTRQVLGKVPGLTVTETEGAGFPSNGIGFRGLNPNQSIEMNTRQNGYIITADIYGYPEAYYIPPAEALERVDLIRGAAALQYGPQFGGVINYIIKSPDPKPFSFQSIQTVGSYNLYNNFTSIGGTLGKWTYYAYLQYKTVGGWRPNSDYRQASGFGRVQYSPNTKLKVGLEYSLLRNQIHMPGGLSDAQYDQNSQQSFRARNWLNSPWNIIAATASWQISPRTELNVVSSFLASERNLVWRNEDGGPQQLDTISVITNTYTPREVEHEDFTSWTTEARLLTHYSLGKVKSTFVAGARYFNGNMRRQGGGPGSTGIDFDLNLYGGAYKNDLYFTTQNLALYAENTFQLTPKFSVTPGARYEYLYSTSYGYDTDDDGNRLPVNLSRSRNIPLLGLALGYQLSASTELYANIAQAYRPIDYSSLTPVGVSSKVDPNLKDANGYSGDLGWRGTLGTYLNFDISGFYLVYNNRIGLITLTDGTELRTNVAKSIHQGLESYLEFSLTRALRIDRKVGDIRLYNALAYIDAHYTDGQFNGNRVEYAPKQVERLGLKYSKAGFSATVQCSYTAESFGDANNTAFSDDATVGKVPAYRVWDFSAGYTLPHGIILKTGVNNFLDAKYFTRRTDEYPGPGIIPSTGRTAYVSFGIAL